MKKRFCLLAAIGMSALVLSGCDFKADVIGPVKDFFAGLIGKKEEPKKEDEKPNPDQEGQEGEEGQEGQGGEGEQTHTHTYSTEWSYNETHHWHAATCEHQDEKSDYAEHTFVKDEDETVETCICGASHVLVSELATPTNLAFDLGKLTWDAVEHAKRYSVAVYDEEDELLGSVSVTSPEIDLYQLDVGFYTVKVTAEAGQIQSEAASIEILQSYYLDGPRILEAEDYVINDNHISIDGDAHGGAYALGFDDCGQGMYFQYYSFKSGVRDIEVCYSTGAVGSYMQMYIGTDEDNPITVLFAEDTGWFGDSKTTATVTVQAELQAGWNDIYLMKNGTGADYPEYGGWAQIDYITIDGSGDVIDLFDHINTLQLTSYRLEAEMAKWHWTNEYARPNMNDAFPSHGYLGQQDDFGDGVEFDVYIDEAGTYLLKFAAAAGPEGRYYDVTVNGVTENRHISTGPSWDNVQEDAGFLVHLGQGVNVIDFSRGSNGSWSCIDYLAIEFVSYNDPVLPTEVENIQLVDNILSFDAVNGISEYRVILSKDDDVLFNKVINTTQVEIPASIHGENILASVYTKAGFFEAAEPSTALINPGIITDKDLRLEAEDAIIGDRHYAGDGLASGGAYALAFDQRGEGMYYRYYAYEAGEREIDIAYATGMPNSRMDLRIGLGTPQAVYFPENTNWFGDGHVMAIKTVTVELSLGWNDIFLYKNGTSGDNPQWGGYVQIDYIEVKGTQKSFDVSELTDLVCTNYKLEAEFGNYQCTNAVPNMDEPNYFSLAFLGEQNTQGDGVTYKFRVDEAGTYKVQFYCGGPGSAKVDVYANNNKITDEGQDYYTLTTGNNWNVVAADPGFEVELNAGWNTLQLSRRGDDGSWICIDYAILTLQA